MRYLTLSKSGIWQFRYQIPQRLRLHFDDRCEIKRSLKTSSKRTAKILALKLELEILQKTEATFLSDELPLSTQVEKICPPSQRVKTPTKLCPYETLERFYNYKLDHVAIKTADSLKAQCKTILELSGKSSLKKIRRAEAEEIKKKLQHYPTNKNKQPEFKNLNAVEAVKLNERMGKPSLSEESIKDYIQKCSSFFEWCLVNELTDVNPFKGLKFKKLKKDSEGKHHYTASEQITIFSDPIFTSHEYLHPYYFWLPILAKFTGARLNELCQLHTKDIKCIDSIWCISITDERDDQKLKTLQSKRLVPLHDFVIQLGFLRYVESLGNNRLFPELKMTRDGYGSAPSKWFGRFKSRLGFAKKHDFHSFRHTAATELKNAMVAPEVAASILGHLLNNITYDRYGKGYELKVLKNAVDKIPSEALKSIKPYTNTNSSAYLYD